MKPKRKPKPPFDLKIFLTKANGGRTNAEYRANESIFVQGDDANAIFYIKKGEIKLTVLSKQGKEAVVAILNDGDFFGEGCLAGQPVRMASAVAMSECSVMKVEKAVVVRLLHEEPSFSELFMAHLLSRNIKIEEDLVDQLFNSSEKTAGTSAPPAGELREGRHTANSHSEDQPGNAGRNRRHDAFTGSASS